MVWICAKMSYLRTGKKDRTFTLWKLQKRVRKTKDDRDRSEKGLQVKIEANQNE